MEQVTAIEWLKKQIKDYGSNSHLSIDWHRFYKFCEQAKEMEKEQIMDAYLQKRGKNDFIKSIKLMDDAENYYNETYGDNK